MSPLKGMHAWFLISLKFCSETVSLNLKFWNMLEETSFKYKKRKESWIISFNNFLNREDKNIEEMGAWFWFRILTKLVFNIKLSSLQKILILDVLSNGLKHYKYSFNWFFSFCFGLLFRFKYLDARFPFIL